MEWTYDNSDSDHSDDNNDNNNSSTFNNGTNSSTFNNGTNSSTFNNGTNNRNSSFYDKRLDPSNQRSINLISLNNMPMQSNSVNSNVTNSNDSDIRKRKRQKEYIDLALNIINKSNYESENNVISNVKDDNLNNSTNNNLNNNNSNSISITAANTIKNEFSMIGKIVPFELITTNPNLFHISKLSFNNSYNRYANIFANDSSIYSLNSKRYINANNIIPAQSKAKTKFISTQAPIHNSKDDVSTMDEFFEMITQAKTTVIITLTNKSDTRAKKVYPYWTNASNDNDDENTGSMDSWKLGNYSITSKVTKHTNNNKIILRDLTITDSRQPNDSRQVMQIHYTGWPDHGVINDPNDLIQVYQTQSQYNQANNPVVIHCSAGIGRTGCYVCSIFGIEQLQVVKQSGYLDREMWTYQVNIMSILIYCRLQRNGMVQSLEQYKLIYLVIEHYLNNYI